MYLLGCQSFNFKKRRAGGAAAAEATGFWGVLSIFQACGRKLAYHSGFCLIGAARSAAASGQTVYCSFTSLGRIEDGGFYRVSVATFFLVLGKLRQSSFQVK